MGNKITTKAGWLINRLRCMSLPEIAYRTRGQLLTWHEKKSLTQNRIVKRPSVPSDTHYWINREALDVNEQLYIRKANKILNGHVAVFQRNLDSMEMVDAWNRDPLTLRKAPMVYGKDLNYRDEALVGDIKYLWEPNRHLHLIPISQAYHLSKNPLYLKGLRLHIHSWILQCPYLIGPNWSSSLEVAIRLINWSVVWQLVGGPESELFSDENGEKFRSIWLDSIYQHMEFISKHFSKYSSGNNHLIGEAAGLFIGSNTWPYWGEITDKWRSISHGILCAEAQKQLHLDGGTREQAISYQQFVLDFLILSLLSGKSSDVTFPEAYRTKIMQGVEFLRAMMNCNGDVPMIGDADDGYVVSISPEQGFCPYKSLIATGAVLFQRPDLFLDGQQIDDKTRWLVGVSEDLLSNTVKRNFLPKKAFTNSGYYILGDRLETKDEIKCIVDCGPLGYLSIAAHGHADALAIYLSVGGVEFLIDPGTYCYHTRPKWREYFRGTSAHNTLRVDRVEQSVSGGNFMWIQKADAHKVRFESTEEVDAFEGRHDGYRRLDDPVTHSRKVVFEKKQKTIYVTDTIQCRQKHDVERFWHFHENCVVEKREQSILAENMGLTILMSPGEHAQIDLHRQNDALPLGWVSRHYDRKVPSCTAVFSNTVVGTTTLHTQIKII